MKADRQSRKWPYVALFLCLFTISVTAPQAWQKAARRYRQDDGLRQASETRRPPTTRQQPFQMASGATRAAPTAEDELVAAVPHAPSVKQIAPSEAGHGVISDVPHTNVRVSNSDERLAMRIPHTTEPAFQADLAGPQLSSPAGPEIVEPEMAAAAEPETEANEAANTEATDLALVKPQVVESAEPADPSASFSSESVDSVELEDIASAEASIPEADLSTEEPQSSAFAISESDDLEISSLEESRGKSQHIPQREAIATDEQDVIGDPSREDLAEQDEIAEDLENEDSEAEDVHASSEQTRSLSWAAPQILLEQMAALEDIPAAAAWVGETRSLIERLSAQPLPTSGERGQLLAALHAAQLQIQEMAAKEKLWETKAHLLRVQYALARRLDLWQAIDALGAPLHTQVLPDEQANPRLEQRLSEIDRSTKANRAGVNWRQLVQFDALQYALGREDATPGQRRRLAFQALGRMAALRKKSPQQSFANSPEVERFDTALREWSAAEIDLCRLLDELEQFESKRLPHLARSISEQRQSLLYSANEAEQTLGKRIEQNYRNANVRLAISEDLMNRFLPEPQVFDAPVADTIMGASVSGNSRTLNKLRLRLIPDERKIRLGLEAHGVVHSNTGASSGPVTIYNRGKTNYVARKLILVSNSGLHVWPAIADATSASDTQAIDTKYDSIPLVRSIVRNMAQTQQDEAYDRAMTEVETRVENTVRHRLDKEADPRINRISLDYVQKLQGPLERLNLAPTPISLSTNEERAIIRFRIAGDNQLGAHTPRPCAPSDSLASVQVHESVLNNAADQLGLNGQSFTLPQLHGMLAEKLNLPGATPDDLPEDAQVTFAPQDAVLIRCDDGKIWVTLSIAELSQGRRSFRNFKATAAYHLLSHGLHTELERDGVVQLAGRRLGFGDQIALRGVISKMFSQNRRPQVIPAERAADPRLRGLRVSQLVVIDGWIGLAVAPERLARGKMKASTSANR
jgi:hypothetical protein